jgi:hypothetical protein
MVVLICPVKRCGDDFVKGIEVNSEFMEVLLNNSESEYLPL